MRIVRTIAELRAALKTCREANQRIGFVPTMGYLHEGHAALIRHSSTRCDATVVSVFVNPAQFGPQEDLGRYPRDLERDQNLCLKLGVKYLFLPEASEMYPTGFSTFVEPGHLGELLCGRQRPGHFRGVLTVVSKLFNIVQPDLAFFGQKDLQQAVLIRRMVKDLNLPVDIMVAPTVREHDGLAMSSRNSYLSPGDRQRALAIGQGLRQAEAAFKEGERRAENLRLLARRPLEALDEIQYCQVVDAATLDDVAGDIGAKAVAICVAARVGGTRLIDNVLLGSPDGPHFLSHLEA